MVVRTPRIGDGSGSVAGSGRGRQRDGLSLTDTRRTRIYVHGNCCGLLHSNLHRVFLAATVRHNHLHHLGGLRFGEQCACRDILREIVRRP